MNKSVAVADHIRSEMEGIAVPFKNGRIVNQLDVSSDSHHSIHVE